MALLGAVSAGLSLALIKKLRETNGNVIIYLYFCLLGFAMSLPPFILDPRVPHSAAEWLMLGGIVVSSILGQILMNEGFRYCKSWEGGVYLMAEVILTSILGIAFLGESATWRFWVGGLLILGSAIALNLRKPGPLAAGEPMAPPDRTPV
jgi:drug/metabolite transporter (DMT)-like permease